MRFRRQAPMGPFVADFACHRAKLVVEVDGGIHDTTDVALRDLKRDEWLTGQGYRVVRVTNRQVEDDIESVITIITGAAPFPSRGKGRGWGGATASPLSPGDSAACPADEYRISPATTPAGGSTPSQPFPLEGKGFSDA